MIGFIIGGAPSRRGVVMAPGAGAEWLPVIRRCLANGSVGPLVAIGLAITKKGSKVLPDDVRPS
jgi:hypothetical protein